MQRRLTDKERAQVIKRLVANAAVLLRRAVIIAEGMETNRGWWLAQELELRAYEAEEALNWVKDLLEEE